MHQGPDGSPPPPAGRNTPERGAPPTGAIRPSPRPRPQPTGPLAPGWLVTTAVVLAGGWLVGGVAFGQFAVWAVIQFLLLQGTPAPFATWPVAAALITLVGAAPAGLAALLVRRPRLTAVVRCWALAAGCAVALGFARLVPAEREAVLALVTAVVAALLAVWIGWRNRPRQVPASATATLTGVAVGLAVTAPWWWLGALGSLTDTLAGLLAAAAVGGLVSAILHRTLWPAFAATTPWRRTLLGGLAAGVALVPIAGAAGGPGPHLALLLVLPACGFALAALADPPSWTPTAALAALAALGPFALVDPEEVSLVLVPGDVPVWVTLAAVAAAGVALLAGLVAGLVTLVMHTPGGPSRAAADHGDAPPESRANPGARGRRTGAVVLVAVLAATVGWGHAQIGNAGFHGERLFVVLKSQADLGGITGNAAARRGAVYRRLVTHAERTQAALRHDLEQLGFESTPYYLVNGIEVDDNPVVRTWLAGRDEVDRVLDSPRLRPLPVEPAPERGASVNAPDTPTPGLVAIGAPNAWGSGTTGRGIVVGVSDSGVDGDHVALQTAFRGGVDSWYDPWNGTARPVDRQGHGTHTTATAVGSRNVGVAPGAQWIGCVNLARNWGNPAYYLDCLQFMLAPFGPGGDPFTDGDPSRAADVLNNSWGCTPQEGCDAGSLRQATRALRSAGIFVVVSAGNSGPRCSSVSDPLALYDEAFSVGAADARGRVADFSSRGPVTVDGSGRGKPDLVAPGVNVVSALPDGTYGPLDGTSMAGPHVAGVVALLWEAAPRLRGDIDATEQILRTTASRATATYASREPADRCGGDQNITGAGLVNAGAAVAAARALR